MKKKIVSKDSMFFDLVDYERSCLSKVKYETEWQAKFAADECYQKSKIKLHWYHCEYCNRWHLTSSSK